jgi:GNAT superfamily N-acetyltransferase
MIAERANSEWIRAIEENRVRAFSTFGRVAGGSLLETEKMLKMIPPSQIQIPLCAWVFDAKLSQDGMSEQVEQVIEDFQRRAISFGWQTGPSTRPCDLGTELEARGMAHLVDIAGMALDLEHMRSQAAPKGLVTRQLGTRDEFRAWAHAFCRSFGIPDRSQPDVAELMAAAWEGSQGRWHHYLGMLDGTPVASSAMYLDRNVAGLYFVGTIPSARKQGIGTWMTRLGLQEARALGVRMGILHASPLGKGMYSRMGFKEYCKLGIYMFGLATEKDSSLGFIG